MTYPRAVSSGETNKQIFFLENLYYPNVAKRSSGFSYLSEATSWAEFLVKNDKKVQEKIQKIS